MWKHWIVLVFFCSAGARAQELLTLDMAIQQALEYNFDIRIARNDVLQAETGNTIGAAGMSPAIDVRGGITAASQNVRNEFLDGRVQQVTNAASLGYNGAVALNWTLFDGGKMFLLKKQLNTYESASNAVLKERVQSVISQVIQAYASVVWQQQQGVAIDSGLALAKTRMELSRLKYETGVSAKVDYLQASVDYNSRRSDSMKQQGILGEYIDTLNALMGQQPGHTYSVMPELEVTTDLLPEHAELLEQINPAISVAKFNAEISRLNAGIYKANFFPVVALNGGYTYNNNKSQAGFIAFSQSYGANGGVSLSLPLFHGGNIRRESKIASLQYMQQELLLNRQTTEIGRRYQTAWTNYKVAVSAYRLERENIHIARENLDIQKERFRAGIASTLETREAENGYVQAMLRYYTATYNLKINETLVLELEGALLK